MGAINVVSICLEDRLLFEAVHIQPRSYKYCTLAVCAKPIRVKGVTIA